MPPLLGIAHISHRIIFSLACLSDDGRWVDISISLDDISTDDIDDLFAWEFSILCSFGNLTLISGSVDIYSKEFLIPIASESPTIGSLHPLHEATCLELLQCIIPDQIYQINAHDDE